MVRAMEHQSRIANSRFDLLKFSRNQLDDSFDGNGNCCGNMKTRGRQVLPNHVAEIRLNHLDTHDMFECSSVSRFNSKNGIIKKIDRHMETHENQVIIG